MPENGVYAFDPLQDPRWPGFVLRHPDASVFHTRGWLRALQRTYGYEPLAVTTTPPSGELQNAFVFCVVRSWLTGNRLVSLPFSDHCTPLVQDSDALGKLLLFVRQLRNEHGWKYVEFRPTGKAPAPPAQFQGGESFCWHRLNLRPSLDRLFNNLHKDSVQRKIRRAEREALSYETGRSERLIQKLYRLLTLTRQRHGLPPQPIQWFRHLMDSMGDDAWIGIASKGEQATAGILVLQHARKVVYKYGGSDTRLNKVGGMALIFWNTIQQAKQSGAEEFDLGRSDYDQPGLIAFKNHWGAEQSRLTYWRYPAVTSSGVPGWRERLAKQVFTRLPTFLLAPVGKALYRHMG